MPGKEKPKAVSKAQQKFFGLVRAVQKGKVSPNKVTSNVRDAAKDTKSSDAKSLASTPKGKLPKRVEPEKDEKDTKKKDEAMEPAPVYTTPSPGSGTPAPQEAAAAPGGMNFMEIVGRYNEYGRMLKRKHSLGELAQQLADIAEYAEYALANEQSDWFDAHTISRNVKEIQNYSKEFAKVAQEADAHHTRLEALYDDMGRILERYFDIYDTAKEESDTNINTEIRPDTPVPTSASPYNAASVGQESKQFSVTEMTKRVINVARSRLTESEVEKFDALPIVRKVLVSWRMVSH